MSTKFTEAQLIAKGYVMRDGVWLLDRSSLAGKASLPTSEELIGKPHQTKTAQISKTRREPKHKRMTKCEEMWYRVLKDRAIWEMDCKPCIIPQFRLRASAWDAVCPTHYTADFAYWSLYRKDLFAWDCVLWEVKDKRRKAHSDELTRPKLVREHNPFVSAVWLAEWDGKEWNERRLA